MIDSRYVLVDKLYLESEAFRYQTITLQNRFENLIKNEIPVLIINDPTNIRWAAIKSKDYNFTIHHKYLKKAPAHLVIGAILKGDIKND